jgi:hypothetical protein
MTNRKFSTGLVCALFAITGTARASYIVQTSALQFFSGNGWTNGAEYNFNTTGALFSSPNGGATAGTTDTTGTATAAFDQSSLTDSNAAASAYAYANLATGTLGVQGSASGYFSEALVQAQFSDLLHYTVMGANSSTITDIGITFSVDGSMAEAGFGVAGLTSAINLDSAASEETDIGDMLSGGTCMSGPCIYHQFTAGTWVSQGYSINNVGDVVFNGVFALTGASGDLSILATLSLTSAVNGVSGAANDDFSHTAMISLSLPQGVSYTSDSGVFLTQSGAAVPEPSTVWLGAAGIAFVGMMLRKKRAS